MVDIKKEVVKPKTKSIKEDFTIIIKIVATFIIFYCFIPNEIITVLKLLNIHGFYQDVVIGTVGAISWVVSVMIVRQVYPVIIIKKE